MVDKIDKIWVEIEYPKTEEEGHRRAKLMSNFLAKVGYKFAGHETVMWDQKRGRFMFTNDEAGGFLVPAPPNHGLWINLTYYGKD
jgi:hypothetical protein